MAMYFCKQFTTHSLPEIGEYFGGDGIVLLEDGTEMLFETETIPEDTHYFVSEESTQIGSYNLLDESAYELVFTAGIYATWLNAKGDKIKNLGPGSFPEELLKTHHEIFKKFKQGPSGKKGTWPKLWSNPLTQGLLAMNAGPTAQLIASLVEEPTEIYLIGMDIYSNNDRVNNVYKGKGGYMTETGNAVPPNNFIYQHRDMFNLFPNIKHYKINKHPLGFDAINQEVSEWKDAPNLEYLTYAEMFGKLADR